MLVLTRKAQERIQIGDNITITVVRIKGRSVRIGIEAPDQMRIIRGELAEVVNQFRDTDEPGSALPAPPRRETPTGEIPSETSNGAESGGPPRCLHTAPAMSTPPSRIPGASRASLIRTPSRLGPASLRSFRCR